MSLIQSYLKTFGTEVVQMLTTSPAELKLLPVFPSRDHIFTHRGLCHIRDNICTDIT